MLIPENLQKIYQAVHRKTKKKVIAQVAGQIGTVGETARLKITGKLGVTDDEFEAIDTVLKALPLVGQVAAHPQPA